MPSEFANAEETFALATNPTTSPAVLDRILRYQFSSEKARRAVMRNPSADIATLRFMADDFPTELDQNEALWFHELAGGSTPDEREDLNGIACALAPFTEHLDRLAFYVTHPDEHVRIASVDNPRLRRDQRLALASDPHRAVRWAVARCSRSGAGLLGQMAKSAEDRVRQEVAKNTTAPLRSLRLLSMDPTPEVVALVASNVRTPRDTLLGLANHRIGSIRQQVALHEGAPDKALARLAHDDDPHVRARVAGNPSCPAPVLFALSMDKDTMVRVWVASNKAVSPKILATLAKDRSSAVRARVAGRETAPRAVLLELSKDKKRDVAKEAEDTLVLLRENAKYKRRLGSKR